MSRAWAAAAGRTCLAGLGALAACADGGGSGTTASRDAAAASRTRMVADQIESRGIADPTVLEAMRLVPRERFVPADVRSFAFDDGPLSIGEGQTISQPYIVALMTELARPRPGKRVLEVGTGSGYQAAVLAACGCRVYTIEIVEPLARRAETLLRELGYDGITVRVGDGYDGWPEEAPFDAIVVTAAPTRIPEPLLAQLAVGGALVIPVGAGSQDLLVVTRTATGFARRSVLPVRFVPMTGKVRGTPPAGDSKRPGEEP